jgi:hypothetical protein
MKIAIRVLLAAALIGGGIWLWMYFNPGPEKAIRRRLAAMAEEISFRGQEGIVAKALHAQKFASYFAPEVGSGSPQRDCRGDVARGNHRRQIHGGAGNQVHHEGSRR